MGCSYSLDYPPISADLMMTTVVCNFTQKKLKFEEVLCPICREIYIEPIALPCKHVVCLECLEKTVENNRLVCPICRTRIGTFIRLAKNLKKTVDQAFWERLKCQFPSEIKRKLKGEEDGLQRKISDQSRSRPPKLAEQGAIKEEFDEMFHKLKIEEEKSRRAEQIASEELAKKLMEEELEKEMQRKRKCQEIAKSDALYIKSLILSENGQKGHIQQNEGEASSSSSVSNDHDSISDELRHFTPICIAPKTPPKRLPNGKLRDTTIVKPINLSSLNNVNTRVRFGSLKNKMPLKVLSNNFLRTKPPSVEDVEMDDVTSSEISVSASDLNSNITQDLPPEIIKEQEILQQRIKQEQEDMAIAIRLHNKWNKEKSQVKRKHGYQLRSAKRKSKRKT